MSEIEIINLVPHIDEDLVCYKVCALEIDGECLFIDSKIDLMEHQTQSHSPIQGFDDLFERIALDPLGPSSLTKKGLCVPAEPNKEIYRIRKGDYRVFWFYGKEKIIICSQITDKRYDKHKKRHIDKAKEIRNAYIEKYND